MPLSECTRACASLARILTIIDSTSNQCYVVGGFVRDSVLGREPQDIDIVVPGDAFALAERIAQELGASFVPLDQQRGIARVVYSPQQRAQAGMDGEAAQALVIDLSRREGSVEDDLARRDFTIDAMAVPVAAVMSCLSGRGITGEAIIPHVLDTMGGLRDLEDGIIRACTPDAFDDDPGRLLRAVRLSRELGFTIEPHTESLIRERAHLASTVAAERTREELLKLLSMANAADGVRHLDRLGLLTSVIPELESCRDVEQPTVHFWDVLEHSFQTITTYEFLTGQADWRYGNEEMLEFLPLDPACRAYLAAAVSQDSTRDALIKLTCLLHDIAKPQTKSIDDAGRARFLGHPKEGAVLAGDILKRLRFSGQEIAFVETLVTHHLRPSQMSDEGMPSSRAVYRFFRDTGNVGIAVLFFAMADYLACRGPLFTMAEWRLTCQLTDFILREQERQENMVAPSQLIDGHELMRALELEPGRTVGILLEAIKEAHAAGLIHSKAEALQLARRTIESEHSTVRTSK